MHRPGFSLPIAAFLVLAGTFIDAAAPTVAMNRQDEKTLRAAGVSLDSPRLLAYLRKRTLTASQRRRVHELIPKLGDDAFKVRQQASLDLLTLGPGVVPHLRAALNDPDEEIKERVRSLLAGLNKGSDPAISAAAVRLLRARAAPGAIEGLLDYLPDAASDEVIEEVLATLAVRGVREGKVVPAVAQALKDAEPSRRGAAAVVVARSGHRAHRATIERLLGDASPLVRFRVAQGLLAAGDRVAIPALIALLTEGPPKLAGRADELLRCVAGAHAPPLAPGDDPASRRRCRAAWASWWRFHARIDLSHADVDLPIFNATLRRREIARRFVAASLTGNAKTLNKLAEMPFLVDGQQILQEPGELERLMADPMYRSGGEPAASPSSSVWVVRNLDDAPRTVSPIELAFLARFRKGEVHAFEIVLQRHPVGASLASIVVLVRLTEGQTRVVGLDGSRGVSPSKVPQ